MRSRGFLILSLTLTLALLRCPGLAAGEVNMTRLTVTGAAELTAISAATLEELCADPEGCEVVVVLRVGSIGVTKTGRLFMLPAANWFSSETTLVKKDNDNVNSVVLTLTDSGFTCQIADADLTNTDSALGFVLLNTGPADDVVCVATFTD